MYTAQEVVQDKFWIVLAHGGKVGTLRATTDGDYEFFDQRTYEKTRIADLASLFDLKTAERDHDVTVVNKTIRGYPTGFPAPIEVEHPVLPVFKKSETGKSLTAAGYYIIKFKDWLPSFAPKLATLDKYIYKGPYLTEWEMNLELKKQKRQGDSHEQDPGKGGNSRR